MVDQLVGDNPNRFFYALAKKGLKLPQGFDVSTIVEEEKTQNPFSLGMPSSQQMSTIPFGMETHMETTTIDIPSTSTFGNKSLSTVTQGKTFTIGSSSNSMGKTLTNPLFQKISQGFTSQGPTSLIQNENQGPILMLQNTNQGSLFQFQGAPSSSQHPPNKPRKVHIVSQRIPKQNNNQGSIPSLQNNNQGFIPSPQNNNQGSIPSFQNSTQGIIPSLQNTNQGPTYSSQNTNQRIFPSCKNINQGPTPSCKNFNQGPIPPFQNINQGPTPPFQNSNQGPNVQNQGMD